MCYLLIQSNTIVILKATKSVKISSIILNTKPLFNLIIIVKNVIIITNIQINYVFFLDVTVISDEEPTEKAKTNVKFTFTLDSLVIDLYQGESTEVIICNTFYDN